MTYFYSFYIQFIFDVDIVNHNKQYFYMELNNFNITLTPSINIDFIFKKLDVTLQWYKKEWRLEYIEYWGLCMQARPACTLRLSCMADIFRYDFNDPHAGKNLHDNKKIYYKGLCLNNLSNAQFWVHIIFIFLPL